MATKRESVEVASLGDGLTYPCYVYLNPINPYRNKVVCNGITVTTTSKTLITNAKMMAKLKQIMDYVIIEKIEKTSKKS